jgi:transposase-like protein
MGPKHIPPSADADPMPGAPQPHDGPSSPGAPPGTDAEAAGADAEPVGEVAPETVASGVERREHGSRGPKKRACFHCGAMTSVKVLEKTGDLCWKCYRPAGYSLLKNLLVLTVSLLLLAGLLVSWKVYFEEDTFLNINMKKPPQDYKPREFTTEQKVQILRRHLLDRIPAKEICEEYEVPAAEFARWRQQFFENAEATFDQGQNREPNATERRAQAMEQKIQVIEKLLTDLRDHLAMLKKESGKYESTTTQRYILESAGPPPRENK